MADRSLPGLLWDLARATVEARIRAASGVRPGRRRFRSGRRSFAAGSAGRLTEGWHVSLRSINADLRMQLPTLRARSRDLAVNNDYAKRFFGLCKTNIVGPQGLVLQPRPLDPDGSVDEVARDAIANGWKAWGKRGSCEMGGRLDWPGVQRQAVETVSRDGEVFVRKVTGANVPNEEGFALQLLEGDHVPVDLEGDLPNGNRLIMGVEVDGWSRPVAYHVATEHPGDAGYGFRGVRYVRVPAAEMIHLFLPIRAGQVRGYPWIPSAMIRLQMLGAYEDAEVVAARIGASKMGFLFEETGEEYDPTRDDPEAEGAVDPDEVASEAEPGIFERLPPGVKFQGWNPEYPAANFDPFVKRCLHGLSAGLDVSYMSLSGDLEGTSYSSGRIGLLDEREAWKTLQAWLVDGLGENVFDSWLPRALLVRTVPLRVSAIEKYRHVRWQPRRWKWTDPAKEMIGYERAIKAALTSRTRIAAESGEDFTEIVEELRREREMMKEAGLIEEGGGDATA